MSRGKTPVRVVTPDAVYNSQVVEKFIRRMMVDGKKGVSTKITYTAMSTIDCISSIVINGCENPQYYDTVVTAVMPTIIEVFSNNECDFYDASLMIVRTFANFYANARTTQNMIWELFPRLVSIIQMQAIDYIGGFFPVVDCYMSIPGSGMLDHQFNGKSYLEMMYDFVSSVAFDSEISDVEQCYAMAILMIIIHYYMGRTEGER